jgi:hypothetical protein
MGDELCKQGMALAKLKLHLGMQLSDLDRGRYVATAFAAD